MGEISDVFMMVMANLVLMIFGFVGTSLYLRGSFTARLDAEKETVSKTETSIKDLYCKTDALEKEKATVESFEGFRKEMLNMTQVNREERREDFQVFKTDVRLSMKEFKEDVKLDINNVLVAFKKNNGHT